MEELKHNLNRIEEEAKRIDAESSKFDHFIGLKNVLRKFILSSIFGMSAWKRLADRCKYSQGAFQQ